MSITIEYLWKDRKRHLGMPLSFTRYQLSEDRLFLSQGFLNIKDDEVLLYRVRDIDTRRNLFQRLFGVGTVTVLSSDRTTPTLVLKNVKDPLFVKELIHKQVEEMKLKRRVRYGEIATTGDHDDDDECDDPDCACHHHHHDDEEDEDEHAHHHHHHHHADEVFTSWGKETPHKFNEDKLKETLDELANTEEYGIILRAKGIVPSDGTDWLYFDLVPGEYEIRKGNPDITGKLCVIGSKLAEDKLAELFEV